LVEPVFLIQYVTITMRIAGKKGIPPRARFCEGLDREGVFSGVKFHSAGTANGKRHNIEPQNFECSYLSTFGVRYSVFDIRLFDVAFSIEPAACRASRRMVA